MAKTRPAKKRTAPSAAAAPAPRLRRWTWLAGGLALLALAAAARFFPSCSREAIGHDRAAAPSEPAARPAARPERLRVKVIARYPHRRDAYTQGLVWDDGKLYESTGLEKHSSLRLVELETGEALRQRDDDPHVFAEGLALAGDLLYQITWHDGLARVFRRDDFALVREHRYEGEGWGLCFDGSALVMSDGSDRLAFRNLETFAVERTVSVRIQGQPVSQLNELECVDRAVWANIFQDDRLVRIDASTGEVTAVVDASGLLSREERVGANVLNGIAWMPERSHFLITGKHWPWLFEVVFEPLEP